MMGFSIEGEDGREQLEALEMGIAPMLDIPEDMELEQREMEDLDFSLKLMDQLMELKVKMLQVMFMLNHPINFNFHKKDRSWMARFCPSRLRWTARF